MRKLAAPLSLLLVVAGLVGASATASNDDFADAVPISLPYAATLSNVGATVETGEPNACSVHSGTLWFSYTPSADIKLRLNTFGSDFDTTLAVYQGASLGSLTPVACNDDHRKALTDARNESFLYAEVRAGQTYMIQAGGFDGSEGTLLLDARFEAPLPPPCAGPCASFELHDVPPELDTRAGEVSLAVDPRTNETLFLMLGRTLHVDWSAGGSPDWRDVSGLLLTTTNDPILEADPDTGRIVIAQLRAAAATAASVIGITDDAGDTWTLGQPAALGPSWDHQTIGIGPYPLGVTNPVYPNAMYYCAQAGIQFSQCARSDDGGLSWGAPLPMNVLQCSGLHGHVAVAADGSVYVPHKSCAGSPVGTQGFVVSRDMGSTWSAVRVPGTVPDRSDPKIAFDDGGKMYFAAASGGRPVVMVSNNQGATWNTPAPIDLGAQFGIRNTVFPAVVAGDAGRAAVSFYGSTSVGNDQAGDFLGEWHVYVATTIDGGQTWQTVNVTPGDPVQRSCIWLAGGSNPCRNLLDFQDLVIDADGRLLVGIADGCTSGRCIEGFDYGDTFDSHGVIARQVGGPLMRS